MNYTRATDNVAVRPAPTGSTHAPGWYDDGTTVNYEDMNGMMGEIAAAIVALGGTLDTDVYDQLAARLTETVLTNGRFSTSLYAAWIDTVSPADYGIQGYIVKTEPIPGVVIKTPYFRCAGPILAGNLVIGWNPLTATTVVDGSANGFFNDLTVSSKIKNAACADVVFDDGVEIEADLEIGTDLAVGADVGLKVVDLGNLTCDWDTTGTDTEKTAAGLLVTYDEAHAVEFFDLTINNTTGGDVDLNHGETIFCNVTGHASATLISAWCETTTATGATANALMKARFVATRCGDGSGNTRIAVMHAGAKAVTIPASNAGSVTVRVYMQVAKLTA